MAFNEYETFIAADGNEYYRYQPFEEGTWFDTVTGETVYFVQIDVPNYQPNHPLPNNIGMDRRGFLKRAALTTIAAVTGFGTFNFLRSTAAATEATSPSSESPQNTDTNPNILPAPEAQPTRGSLFSFPESGVSGQLSRIFTPSVLHWEDKIIEWANLYGIPDPNWVATIMQIESCAFPDAVSSAGAQSLFQVMPFHFTAGENSMDPDTNARRGMLFFADLLARTGGEPGLAFAGYNGGPGVMSRSQSNWPKETQTYYRYATGILAGIDRGEVFETSPIMQEWYNQRGRSLCDRAEAALGI